MSAIVVILPALPAAWPAVTAAAAAAASALGFAVAKTRQKVAAVNEVEIELDNSAAITQEVAVGEELVFAQDDVQIAVFRNAEGRVGVRALAKGRTDEELRAIAERMANTLTQQYAYNQLMTELKSRGFTVADQQVEEDGTVRLQVRVFQG